MRIAVARIGARGGSALSVLFLLLASLLLARQTASASPATGYARLVQGDAATPTEDVYLDGTSTPLVSGLTFGTSTAYWPVSAGSHTLTVVPSGEPQSASVISASFQVSPGTSYTLATVGGQNTQQALATFADDNSIAAGMSKVRVYHLSPDAGLAAVQANGQTIIPRIDYKQASDYLTVKPGVYNVDLVLQNGLKVQPFSATLEGNKVASVVAVGSAAQQGNGKLQFLTLVSDAVPTGMPPTGVAPAQRTGVPTPYLWLAALAAVLALALRLPDLRRRARRHPATL